MMDEASRLGMKIDGPRLSEILGVPVLPVVASRGRGVQKLFTTTLREAEAGEPARRIPYQNQTLENAVQEIAGRIKGSVTDWDPETLAIWLLEGGKSFETLIEEENDPAPAFVQRQKDRIEEELGKDPVWAFSAERHARAREIVAEVVERGEERVSWQSRLDDYLLHPFWGYVFLVAILFGFFQLVYWVGSSIEGPLLGIFDQLALMVSDLNLGPPVVNDALVGAVQGIAGGAGIVLPYLLPFLLGMGFLEDVGYLPRLAFLMDALMQRMGLHGKAVVPFILGYGCNVPAVMATRTMRERRDRFLAATLAIMVPCAARIAVVFGLVAYYLGSLAAMGIYIFNILVIAFTGRILSWLILEKSPGLILEVPPYRVPTVKTMVQKTWFRAKEFVIEAWPLLIGGSVVLALAERLNVAVIFNSLTRPITWLLGLPSEVGVPLIFGVLRKELSMIMLRQALDTVDISAALSPIQMVTFTVFVVFYIPCLATLAALRRELNRQDMLVIAGLSVVIALTTALFVRGALHLALPILAV
jgi:ferrous iron transport protein B